MKVTQVAVRPTEQSNAAQRPALTPELLAASGARYSRNNEGLEAILAKIDPENLDASVDSIFRMIDYGHQSIADMAPVAMFMDGLSMWLAYYVWTLCPTAGGQESSTRYIRLAPDALIEAEKLGLEAHESVAWRALMERSFAAYEEALTLWSELAAADATLARIPRSLQEDASDKAQKQVARMRRNYAFDRARYFLPVSVATNMMLLMPARGWVQLCAALLSHPLREANELGENIRAELELATPRLLKHAVARDSLRNGLQRELQIAQKLAARPCKYLQDDASAYECPPAPHLDVMPPPGTTEEEFAADLQFHENRYAWIGPTLRRTAVRFAWDAVTFGDIRDLNRHRTGTKFCPLVPVGFYAALDQLPPNASRATTQRLRELANVGREASQCALGYLQGGNASSVYWSLLGTQHAFEHVTTADKFLYEAELRTGTGAHFRYAQHLRDVLALWYQQFPATRGLVIEGSAEPE